jgi:hypothetical protein
MPVAAGFGVGAVVSCICRYLKPRALAQRCFSNEYQLGRCSDLVVHQVHLTAPGVPPQCVVFSPTHNDPQDGNVAFFTVAAASTKLVTSAPLDNRIPVLRACTFTTC